MVFVIYDSLILSHMDFALTVSCLFLAFASGEIRVFFCSTRRLLCVRLLHLSFVAVFSRFLLSASSSSSVSRLRKLHPDMHDYLLKKNKYYGLPAL